MHNSGASTQMFPEPIFYKLRFFYMNINKIILDLTQPQSVPELHQYLVESLDFPEYYGANLDALYDALTDICHDTCIGIHVPDNHRDSNSTPSDPPTFDDYRNLVCRVFQDAEQDNPHLVTLIFQC
jgi:ribonuclease inhibitor